MVPYIHIYLPGATRLSSADYIHDSCASINGINQTIVSRANELAALSARGENLIAACAVLSEEEMLLLGEAVRGSPVSGA